MSQKNILLYNNLKLILSGRNRSKIFEILSVYHGIKRACRITPSSIETVKAIQGVLSETNLFSLCPKYKLAYETDKSKGKINQGRFASFDSVGGLFFLYIGSDEEDVCKLEKAQYIGDNIKTGELLGYPECCIKAYNGNFEDAVKRKLDFNFFSCKDFSVFPYYNNTCLPSIGSFLSHFPCNFKCKESVAYARRIERMMKLYDPDYVRFLNRFLKSLVIYSDNELFFTDEYNIKGSKIYYKNIRGFVENKIYKTYQLLKDNTVIDCRNHYQFEIGGEHFDYKDKGFIVLFQ